MKMKFFRFLYGETGRCFLHLGEIKDTKTGEQAAVLYLRGTNGHVNRTESEHTLFLCPKRVNLVVLGEMNEQTITALKQIVQDSEVNTLVVNANHRFAFEEFSGIGQVISLSEGETGVKEYRGCLAGWRFLARPCGETGVILAHTLDDDGENSLFDDCIMQVKAIDQDKHCMDRADVDGFGCALGCTLHQDYDVCKYQREGKRPYVTGSMLVPGLPEYSKEVILPGDWKEWLPVIRFYGFAGKLPRETFQWKRSVRTHRRYYIGLTEEVSDTVIADIERSGAYRSPAVLREGEAFCAAGLLRYA